MPKNWRKRSKREYFVSNPLEYRLMTKDESVEKWVSNLKKKAGWRTTVPSFLRTLYKFTEYAGKSPNKLITIASGAKKPDQPEELTSATPVIAELAQGLFRSRLLGDNDFLTEAKSGLFQKYFSVQGMKMAYFVKMGFWLVREI